MLGAVAKRYAVALFEIALESGRLSEMDDQATFVAQLYGEDQVREFLKSPKIPAATKKEVIAKHLGGVVDKPLLSLVLLLIDKKRVTFLPDIMAYFDLLTDQHLGVEEVTIVSAVPLGDEQREAILAGIKRFSDMQKLQVSTEVDTGVIGGIKVKLGDNLVIDGTVSSRLGEMRQRLYKYRHSGTGA